MSSNAYTKMAKWVVEHRWNIVEPTPFATLYTDYKRNQQCNNQLMTMQLGMAKYLKKVEQVEQFDITQKVHLLFLLSQAVNEEFERTLHNEGILELDANRRITFFRTNDGSFERSGEPLTRRGRPRKQEEMIAEDTVDVTEVDTPSEDVNTVEPTINQEIVEPRVNQEIVGPAVNQEIVEPRVNQEIEIVGPAVNREIVEPRVNQEIVGPTMDAMRILENLHSLVFVLRKPCLREFENDLLQELRNQRRRNTRILERDFLQSFETGLRILVNGATNQQDGEGIMRLNDILIPLSLQLLNMGIRHNCPLVKEMIAMTSEEKSIPIRKVKNVLDLLFEAATPAVG
uniref:SPK domain-containing protein n=1 Tax=Caenorhabditis tropicalis TaxID=1561998 RepID=A0A1I7UQD4_9PELO